jgi:hypothetical protein
MPVVHQCAAPDCDVVTMGAFCINHEREAVPAADVLLYPVSNAAVRSRAADLRPTDGRHAHRTRRSLRAVPTPAGLTARPR